MPYKYDIYDLEPRNSKTTVKSGIGFFGFLSVVLTAVFTVLKLINKIDWSWVWVLSPLWIYLGLSIIIVIVVFVCYIVIFRSLSD